MRLTKKRLAVILCAAVLAIAIVLGLALPALSRRAQLDRQFTEAQRFLDDLDYESALIAFSKILEIDPNNIPVYRGMAQAYIGLGDYDAAIAILEEGIAVTDSDELRRFLDEILAERDALTAPVQLKLDNPALDAAIRAYLGVDADAALEGQILESVGEVCISPTELRINWETVWEDPDMIGTLAADPSFIPFINGCPYARVSIDLYNYPGGSMPDLSPFYAFREVTELNLYGITVNNLDFLRNFPHVNTLTLNLNDCENMESLRVLEDNAYLTLFIYADEQQTLDAFFAAVNGFTQIGSLWLHSRYADDISGLSALSGCTYMEQLILHMDMLADVSPVAAFPQLTDFGLFSMECESIAPLKTLVNLTSIDLRGYSYAEEPPFNEVPDGKLTDISAIACMSNLQRVYIQEMPVSDISVINGLQQLESLTVSEGLVADISSLTDLPVLRSVRLSQNRITDLSALAVFSALEEFDAASNQISDISVFSSMTGLTSIRLSMNPITDIRALSHFPAETQLYLFDCDVTDWSPVSHVDYVYGRPE